MAEAVKKTNNQVLIDNYAQKTALQLGVSPEAVRAEFRKAPQLRGSEKFEETADATPQTQRPTDQEMWLMRLLFANEDLLDWAAAHLCPEWIEHSAVRQVVSSRLTAHMNGNWVSLGAFLESCPTPEQRQLMTEVTATPEASPNPAQQLADLSLTLRNDYIEKQRAGLLVQLSQPQISDEARLELTMRREQLRVAKTRPLAALGEA